MSGTDKAWDFIVVGGGSGGCAATYELARSGKHRVLLLEAGGSDRSADIMLFARVGHAMHNFNWGYACEPDPTRGGRSEEWLAGKVLGGSSSINGCNFVRGSAQDYDRWAATGNAGWGLPGWSYADVLPIFEQMESFAPGGETRGRDGQQHIRKVKRPHRLTKAFFEASTAIGIPYNEDYNSGSQEGVSPMQLTQRKGLRWSAADAFIKPVRSKSNLTVELNAQVLRIQFEGNRATGVWYRQDGVERFAKADKVVLAGGAMNTPKLLMLSGVGNPEELARHGIEVVIASPEVGQNLNEHPMARLVYTSRVRSHNLTGGIAQKLGIALEFAMHREGPVSTVFEGIGFFKTSPDLPHPDLQIHFAPLGYLDTSDDAVAFLDKPSMTIVINKSHPKSRGRLRLASASPDDAPVIEANLLDDPQDLETLVAGIALVRRIMKAEPMASLVIDEVVPGPAVSSDSELRAYLPAKTELARHPSGTCRMGIDDNAVVTPDQRVRGAQNVWIADASIMPDLISGNTNGVCMMMGLKLGRSLAG